MTGDWILLVDDETDFVETLAERMRARGYQVQTAGDGLAALERVKDRPFDGVVLDLAMPGIDGIDTMKLLLNERPELQIILLTGHATVDRAVSAIKLGAMDFVEKPIDFATLMKKVEEASQRYKAKSLKRTQEEIKDLLRKKGW